jgi:hypothetical protein
VVSLASFLQFSHISRLTSGCAHIGLRHASLQAITMEARITLATPNELLLAVKWLFTNRTEILTGHASQLAGHYTRRYAGHSSEAGAQARHVRTALALKR